MKEMKVRLEFFEEVLGTASSDPEIHEKYIASNAPDAPERRGGSAWSGRSIREINDCIPETG